jgi:hypothetical protein
MEAAIRKYKRRSYADEALGGSGLRGKIEALKDEYETFSNAVNISPKWSRTMAEGEGAADWKRIFGKVPVSENPVMRITETSEYREIAVTHTPKQDLALKNPNYATKAREYRQNCQRCVSAYEMRRRGYDVEASERIFDGTDRLPYMNDPNGWPTVYENYELVSCASNTSVGTGNKVRRLMEGWGDGARAIVRVQWRGSGGHVFIAEQADGATRFVDPQSNGTDVADYFQYVKSRETYCMRIDNPKVTDRIRQCCKPRK